jgi:Flp pilus assembly protein TadG
MKPTLSKPRNRRRGIIAVLSAALFIVMLAMIAFAVDVGYMGVVRAQLQAAADSAALAAAGASSNSREGMVQVAQAFAGYHQAGNQPIQLDAADVQFGTWDPSLAAGDRFQALTSGMGTAVKVTVKVASIPVFFGRVFGASSVASQASAVAAVNPRDICFVVDLSSSMNDDTAPSSGTTTHDTLIQNFYNSLFGVTGAGAPNVPYNPSESTKSITGSTTTLKLSSLNTQFPYVVPAAQSANSQYWTDYFNINGTSFSYKKYVQFLITYGRDGPIGGTSRYSIMSVNNPNYKKHSETVGGTLFTDFPASEMPTHALRRAVIAALQVIKERNSTISDSAYKDQVSIIAFDRKNATGDTDNVQILRSLTVDYTDAMNVAMKKIQACKQSSGQDIYCTNSEGGLSLAYKLLSPYNAATNPQGAGREHANKVVIFLTDGNANLKETEDGVIGQYMTAHPGGWDDDYPSNAALMQSAKMQGENWYLYAVGMGLDSDQGFMNKMAVKGGTAKDGKSYDNATDSNVYEETLKSIFQNIITNPKLRLVE